MRQLQATRESGFALLFVFLMAAAAALLFYLELPRIAFERQREKEQLLIERGEQYRRAIQLYVRKFNRYPAEISQLENTNNIRFLRRRYKDPMTGKAEWRLIHAGPGGVLVDSVLNKPAEKESKESSEQAAVVAGGEGGQLASSPIRRRPSETPGMYPVPGVPIPTEAGLVGGVQPPGEPPPGAVPFPIAQPGPPTAPGMQPVPAVAPGAVQGGVFYIAQAPPGSTAQPGSAGAQPGQVPFPVTPAPVQQPGMFQTPPPGQNLMAPMTPPAAPSAEPQPVSPPGPASAPPYPTQNVPGLPGPYGQPGVPSLGAITVSAGAPQPSAGTPPYSTQPGVGGAPIPGQAPFPQPGYQPLRPEQNPALQIIRDILTKPRPGGLAGVSQPAGATGGTQTLGGGIAGVASMLEADSIMVYNERTKYNEWEFVYDVRKDPVLMRRLGLAATPVAGQTDSGKTAAPAGSEKSPSLFAPFGGTRRR